MKGFIANIEEEALANTTFRTVLYTDERVQLVVMSLLPKEDIGEESHELDQFIRVEEGEGEANMEGEVHPLTSGMAIIVPAGVKHNITNTSAHDALKLYTLYAPPNHAPGTVHVTKKDAQSDEERE